MDWLGGLHGLFEIAPIAALFLGTFVGLFLGALPGLGPVFVLTLFLPLTFNVAAVPALVFLVSLYTSAVFGGAITAVLFSVAGHPGNIATVFDGRPLTNQGRAGEAIAAIGVAGAVGGILATLALVFVSPLILDAALKISPADYFMLAVFGMAMVAGLSGRHVIPGLILGGVGFLLSTVGPDPMTGGYRFTLGSDYLRSNGIPFSVIVVGVFALGNAFFMIEQIHRGERESRPPRLDPNLLSGVRALFKHPVEVVRAGVLGTVVGVVPGLGITLSNIMAYALEVRLRPKAPWGRGHLPGVMAPEAADNATMISELIPAFTLGIPGAATSALMLEAITVHGLRPGPTLFTGGSVTAAFFVAIPVSQIVIAVVGVLLARYIARAAELPKAVVAPVIIVMGCLGAFAVDGSVSDIVLALMFGIVGYVVVKLQYPVAPIALGPILGPLAEENYRRAQLISDATNHPMLLNPLPMTLLIASVLVFVLPLLGRFWLRRTEGVMAHAHHR